MLSLAHKYIQSKSCGRKGATLDLHLLVELFQVYISMTEQNLAQALNFLTLTGLCHNFNLPINAECYRLVK